MNPGLVEGFGAVVGVGESIPVADRIVGEGLRVVRDGPDRGEVEVQVAAISFSHLIELVIPVVFVLPGAGGEVGFPGAVAGPVVAPHEVVALGFARRGFPEHLHGAPKPVVTGVGITGVANVLARGFDVGQVHRRFRIKHIHVPAKPQIFVAGCILR